MVPVAAKPVQVLEGEQQPPVALDLLQMLALVAQQALVVLVAGQDVDGAPEAGPACKSAAFHVPGDKAGGGVDGHAFGTTSNTI